LRLLLGDIEPQTGTIKHGTNLEIGYFDQLRESLDPEKSVAENVGDGKTYIRLNGNDRHIIGYLKGFLFSPKRSLTPVKSLSGGERNRIILAKLFTRPANLLVLDEPTNDLDMETLEVLEARLAEYSGTLIVVSHDRQFLDNVVTSTIVFEEGGKIREYVGGYSDWLRQGRELEQADKIAQSKTTRLPATDPSHKTQTKKLSYREQKELDELPEKIEALEKRLVEIQKQISDSDFYAQDHAFTKPVLDAFTATQAKLDRCLERWSALEDQVRIYKESRS